MPATSLTLRLQKGSPLTYTELDNNFLYLTGSISSSLNTAISGSVNRVAVFSSANKITGSSIMTDDGTSLTINGTVAITGPLNVVGTNTVVGNKIVTGSVFISGSKTIIGTNTITGSLLVTGSSHIIKGTTTITGSLLVSGSTHNIKGATTLSGSVNISGSTHTIKGYTTITAGSDDYVLNVSSSGIWGGVVGKTDIGLGISGQSSGTGTGVDGYSDSGVAVHALTTTGTAIQAEGPVQITGSLVASGSTHTLTSTTTNINSTTTTLTSTALYLNSNHITASGQTSGDIDLTIAPGGAGSAIINLKANTGGTSILNATGNNNTLSIKTNSIERINIDGNGTTAITGSLSVTGSNTLIGTKTITGSVFISGSKTIIGTNTITGSLNVSGSVTVKGTVSASSFTGSLFGTASYAVTASYVLGATAAAYKVYSALVSANSGTPTVNVLQNDFTGTTITFTVPSNGVVRATASTPIFTSAKTVVPNTVFSNGGVPYFLIGSYFSTTICDLDLKLYDGTQSSTPNGTFLCEFKVYN